MMDLEDLRDAAKAMARELSLKGLPAREGLSVMSAPDATISDILALAESAKMPILNGSISITTDIRIRAAGFEIKQTGAPPHHTIYLPDGWIFPETLVNLRAAFDAPVKQSLFFPPATDLGHSQIELA